MNRPSAMALWLSTALLLSACSDSRQTDGKSESSKRSRSAGKSASTATNKPAPPPRADDEKEAIAVLKKAKAELIFNAGGRVRYASFRKAKISEEALAQLAKLKMLERLRLDGHDRGFDGAKEPQIQDGDLKYIEGLKQLKRLHLGANYITDKGLKRLKGLTNLEYLYLNDTDITDAGLAHLRGLSKLERLDLKNTSITDEGLDHLRNLPALTRVELIGSLVTDEGVRALRAAVSEDVQIVYQFQSDEPGVDAP